MYWQPVVKCKNPDCPAPSAARIRLAYANSPAATETQPMWPADGWQARVICSACDHWYIYGKSDVEWTKVTVPLSEQSNMKFWCVELECGEPGCTSRTKWHVLDSNDMADWEITEFALRADPVVVCENDHPFAVSGVKAQSAQPVSSI